MQFNKEFWDKQANQFGESLNAVNFDTLSEDLELQTLRSLLNPNDSVCDLGCGNGRLLSFLRDNGIAGKLVGSDFTEGMITTANKLKERDPKYQNISFYHMDATQPDLRKTLGGNFDAVITKRLLINLETDSAREKVLQNISELLKPNGLYLMTECFEEPLCRVNKIRGKLNLDAIKVHEFNRYLTSDFMNVATQYFDVIKMVDFQSTYYFVSRVMNAYLSEGTPSYTAAINQLAVKLINEGYNLIEGYSPEVIYCLRKKSVNAYLS